MTKSKQYIADSSGIAAIEAALMFPFLMLTCFGTMDASYLMLQNHKMESGLSAAGNYLSKTRTPGQYESQAKRLATTGQITTGGEKYIQEWSADDITLSYRKIPNTPTQDGTSYRGGATIDIIELSSAYTYQGIGFLRSISRGSITVAASHEERLIGNAI